MEIYFMIQKSEKALFFKFVKSKSVKNDREYHADLKNANFPYWQNAHNIRKSVSW